MCYVARRAAAGLVCCCYTHVGLDLFVLFPFGIPKPVERVGQAPNSSRRARCCNPSPPSPSRLVLPFAVALSLLLLGVTDHFGLALHRPRSPRRCGCG